MWFPPSEHPREKATKDLYRPFKGGDETQYDLLNAMAVQVLDRVRMENEQLNPCRGCPVLYTNADGNWLPVLVFTTGKG